MFPKVFPTTLTLQLEIGRLSKMLAHHAAMEQPTLRQLPQACVLGFAVGGLRWDVRQWSEWCSELLVSESVLRQAALPLAAARRDLAQRIRLRGKTSQGRGRIELSVSGRSATRKKPASALKRPASVLERFIPDVNARPLKRTAFTRKRGSL